MDFTEEQQLIIEMAARFARERLSPSAAKWEKLGLLDRAALEELGGLGLGAIYARDEFGGGDLGRLDAVLIFEQLAAGDVSHASFLSIHNMAGWMIDRYGSDDLRRQLVPGLASLEIVASYCLTEPNAGSDAGAIRTSARRHGEHYILNGQKAFISGAGFSDVYVVMARTGDDGPRGVSAFVVEKGTPGISFGKHEEKMGWRAQPTATVSFDDCRIPLQNRLGEEGKGFRYAMAGLDGGRLNIAACSLGAAQEACDRAVAYAKQRKQFGAAIAELQAMQFKLADMQTQLEASRALLYVAARKLDAKAPEATRFCAMAKRFVTDSAFAVANDALQVHGGYGYLADYGIERIVRDLRVHQILEGTNEIMRVIIARSLLAEA